jgi:hypothetical protein
MSSISEQATLRAPIEALNHSSKSSQRDFDKEWKMRTCSKCARTPLKFATLVITEMQTLKASLNGSVKTVDVAARLGELETKLTALRTKVV